MKTKKLIKIITNVILLVCFLLTYFLDLTGLEFHQYLGLAAGVLLAVHIITHADWIKQVSKRFFGKLNKRVRFYYILDATLLISIISITLTGVVISTWLLIDAIYYPVIRTIHILSSIIGLLLLIAKMAFHWKFFTLLSRPINRTKQRQPGSVSVVVPVTSKNTYSRREALKLIGAIAAVGGLGLIKAVSAVKLPEIESLPLPKINTQSTLAESTPETKIAQVDPDMEVNADNKRKRRRGSSMVNDPVQLENNALPTTEPTPAPLMEPISESPDAQECVIRCSRGCSYPGQCSRYIDENINHLCDLGECLVV